jgi:tRNA A37 threonylcarbamoyladenosine dehydratase
MAYEFSRTELLIGRDALLRLENCKVAVFGIGGVGSFVVEALARSGVGRLVLVDDDIVHLSNLNRQIHATHSTIGRAKVDVMRERVLEINPAAQVEALRRFYMPGSADELIPGDCDYIVDAVDTVTAKIDLIVSAKSRGIPIISSMGAGNKLDPARFKVADIYETSVDPLAKVMRRELRQRGVESLKVVYSTEPPIKPTGMEDGEEVPGPAQPETPWRPGTPKKQVPGSISFVPSVAGLIIAGEVVKDLIGYAGSEP